MGAAPEAWTSVLDEDLSDVDLDAQMACIKRELAMRQRVYPRWVEAGRMTADEARIQTRAMRAVLKTLFDLKTARGDAAPALQAMLPMGFQ